MAKKLANDIRIINGKKVNSYGEIAVRCPVCGEFDLYGDGDVCEVCGWFHDVVQEKYPDETDCENSMSLNEARKAYAEGREIV